MYSTCLFCHGAFHTNTILEHLGVGRRFAFDTERGRLWIVCNRCAGWNLWPFETRWEALEELEETFSRARRRVSTDQITLARVPPALDLIRVGKPTQTEFASWRYVNQIRRRRRLRFAKWSVGAAGVGLAIGGMGAAIGAVLVSSTMMLGGYGVLFAATNWWALRDDRMAVNTVPAVRVVTDADVVSLSLVDVSWVTLERVGDTGWQLVIGNHEPIVGSPAMQAIAQLLPLANRWGGSPRMVREAVHRLESLDDPRQIFGKAVRHSTQYLSSVQSTSLGIALEIAAHESAERAAMEGELALLERAWQEAESVAAIADGLLVPEYVNQLLARIRGVHG